MSAKLSAIQIAIAGNKCWCEMEDRPTTMFWALNCTRDQNGQRLEHCQQHHVDFNKGDNCHRCTMQRNQP